MLKTCVGSVCAGILISIGGCVYLACDNVYVGATLFSVALFCICYMGYDLFTGKIGYFAEDFTLKNALRLCVMLAGNMITTFLLGLVVRYALPELALRAAELFAKKLSQSFPQTLIRAAFCGVLMYLAVQIFREKKTPLGILFCIPVFLLSGFEHSVADMFYFGASGQFVSGAALFLTAAVLGNTAGSLILPLLGKIGGKNERK